MRIELEIKELTLKDVYNIEEYKEDGLYLVNDGIAYLLVSVYDKSVYTIPLQNKGIVNQYEAKAKTECIEDIKGMLEHKVNYIIELLEGQKNEPLVVTSNTELDIDKITKLVQSVNAPFIKNHS